MRNLIFVYFLFATCFFVLSCTHDVGETEIQKAKTFESIEIGTSLEDARASLTEKFSEYNPGKKPRIDILILEDGNQLIFIDEVLDGKNSASVLDSLKSNYPVSSQ